MCQNGRRPGEVAPILLDGVGEDGHAVGRLALGCVHLLITACRCRVRPGCVGAESAPMARVPSAAGLRGAGVAARRARRTAADPNGQSHCRRAPPRWSPGRPPCSVAAARAHRADPLPGGGVLTKLPGDGDRLALTVDDGVNTDVVRLYTSSPKIPACG